MPESSASETTSPKRYRDTPTVSDIYPCLFYRDAAKAIDFLQNAFGFEKRMVAPGPDDTIAHSELSLGTSVVMVSTARSEKGWVSPRDLPAVNQIVCMYVKDIDAHYARAKAAGARITIELHDTDYGSRDYTCLDPEGNTWSFGTYRPGSYWE